METPATAVRMVCRPSCGRRHPGRSCSAGVRRTNERGTGPTSAPGGTGVHSSLVLTKNGRQSFLEPMGVLAHFFDVHQHSKISLGDAYRRVADRAF